VGRAAARALADGGIQIPSKAVRELGNDTPGAIPAEASSQADSSQADSSQADSAELLTLIPTILLARFNDRPLQEICTMTGLTVEDFTQSVAYREIFGLGKAQEAAKMTLRQLNRRCGPLSEATTARIQALPVEKLEALADALLDFQGPADLSSWLAGNT
jgi:hypothetical protein